MPQMVPRKKKGKRRSREARSEPTMATTHYMGPLPPLAEQLVTTSMCEIVAATSNGAGVLNQQFPDNPTLATDFGNFQTVFAEYRVLALTIEYIPSVEGSTINLLLYNPLYVVEDLTSGTVALGSYAVAANYPRQRHCSLSSRMKLTHRMSGVAEATFVSNLTPVINYSFKFYADTLSLNSTYGQFECHWLIQFRGRE